MSLFESLTSEDLPLSYRFPRWSSALYYPCASIVIFDIDTRDSEVEYHIFVAERDVSPESDNPHISVTTMDGNWRGLTGKAITNITSVDSDSATETTVTLTINFDDLTTEEVSFTIPLSQGGGADSESVAIRVNSDGTLAFGGNFVGDSDSTRTEIKELLDITDSRLIWEERTVTVLGVTSQRWFLTQFLPDSGIPIDIESTDIDTSHPDSTTNTLLWISGTSTAPVGPGPFAPTFFLSAINSQNADRTYTLTNPLDWDEPAAGFRIQFINPNDRQGQAYIQIGNENGNDITSVIGGTVDNNLSNYASTTASGDVTQGTSVVRYRTDANADATASFQPTIANEQINAGDMTIQIDIEQVIGNDPINLEQPNPLTPPGTTDYSHSLANEIRYVWRLPAHDMITINNNLPLTPTGDTTFLNTISEASYQIRTNGFSGILDPTIISHVVTGRGTGVVPADSTGTNTTVTFDPPFSYSNEPAIGNGISVETTFTRPPAVTGTPYDIIVNSDSQNIPAVNFITPSFWFLLPGGSPDADLDRIVAPNTSVFRGGGVSTGVELTSTTQSDDRSYGPMTIPAGDNDFYFAIRSDAIGSTAGSKSNLLGTNPLSFVSTAAGQMNNIIPAQIDVFMLDIQPNIATLPTGYTPLTYTLHRFSQQGPRVVDVS